MFKNDFYLFPRLLKKLIIMFLYFRKTFKKKSFVVKKKILVKRKSKQKIA